MLIGNGGHEIAASERLELVNAFFQRGHTLLIQSHAVHALGIEVTHLLLDAATRIVGAQCGDDVLDLIATILGKLVKCSETRILRVERVVEFPSTASILIEILSGTGLRIQIVAVNSGNAVIGYCSHGCEYHD